MMNQHEYIKQCAAGVCQKWHLIQEKLLNEKDPDKKLYWLYQESVLERRLAHMEYVLSRKIIRQS